MLGVPSLNPKVARPMSGHWDVVWTDPELRLEQVRRRLKPISEGKRLLILAAAVTAAVFVVGGLIVWLA